MEIDFLLIPRSAQQNCVGNDQLINGAYVMKSYATYLGNRDERYRDFKFPKLLAGNHSSIRDCVAALKILNLMSDSGSITVPKLWWKFWKD